MTREDINDIINAICPNDEDYEKPCISPKYLRQELEQLALDQRQWNGEPTTKNDLGVDCISRAQVQTEIEMNAYRYTLAKERGGAGRVEWHSHLIDIDDAVDIIRNLPSVTPQEPKTGYWIDKIKNSAVCSCCNKNNTLYGDFCKWCGAKMIVPQKSEDKE